MNTKKQPLRQKLLAARSALAKETAAEKSSIIRQKLLDTVSWEQVRNAHIYYSVAAWNEVDTAKIKSIIQARWPRIAIISPPPSRTEPPPSDKFDLIIVPVLGFDTNNYRLGLGGGWYDRFLANQPQARTIGLAYASALVDKLPREPHDIPMDTIITEL